MLRNLKKMKRKRKRKNLFVKFRKIKFLKRSLILLSSASSIIGSIPLYPSKVASINSKNINA